MVVRTLLDPKIDFAFKKSIKTLLLFSAPNIFLNTKSIFGSNSRSRVKEYRYGERIFR